MPLHCSFSERSPIYRWHCFNIAFG